MPGRPGRHAGFSGQEVGQTEFLDQGLRTHVHYYLLRWDYHLAMSLVAICSSGLTPVIYLIGGRDYYTRASSSGEKNFVQHIMSLLRGEKRKC